MMEFDCDQITARAKERYELSLAGIHGLSQWRRVQENGLEFASHRRKSSVFAVSQRELGTCRMRCEP